MHCDLIWPVRDECRRPIKVCKGAIRLIKDPITPIRKVEPGSLGQTQQQISHPLVGQHAGVEDDREISVHGKARRSVKASFLGLTGQLVECLSPVRVALLLKRDQVFHSNPAMGSDFVKRELSRLQKLNQVRTGDPEDIGGRLGGQFLSFRNKRNDLALLQCRGHPDQQFVNWAREFGPITMFVDQRWGLGFASEEIEQMANRFRVTWRKLRRVETCNTAGARKRCHGVSRNKRNRSVRRNGIVQGNHHCIG